MSEENNTDAVADEYGERVSFPVPSRFHQTILAKSLYEHERGMAPVAAAAVVNKDIHNSSLGPNLLSSMQLSSATIRLFDTVFVPNENDNNNNNDAALSSSATIQFVPVLAIHDFTSEEATGNDDGDNNNNNNNKPTEFERLCSVVRSLKKMKYFRNSLQSLTFVHPDKEFFETFFSSITFTGLQEFELIAYKPFPEHIPCFSQDVLPALNNLRFCYLEANTDLPKTITTDTNDTNNNNNNNNNSNFGDHFAQLLNFMAPKAITELTFNCDFGSKAKHESTSIVAPFPNLTRLDMSVFADAALNDDALIPIGRLAQLTELDMGSKSQITDRGILEHLGQSLTNLVELNIPQCRKVEMDFDSFFASSGFSQEDFVCFPSLTCLNLSSSRKLCLKILLHLSTWFKNLEFLELGYANVTNDHFFTNDALPMTPPLLPKLTKLGLGHYYTPNGPNVLTTKTVEQIVNWCPRLEELDLLLNFGQNEDWSSNVEAFAASFSKLEKLQMLNGGRMPVACGEKLKNLLAKDVKFRYEDSGESLN